MNILEAEFFRKKKRLLSSNSANICFFSFVLFCILSELWDMLEGHITARLIFYSDI